MAVFTQDWFSNITHLLDEMLERYKGVDGVKYLEIGSFEGMSAIWVLDNILTGKNCKATCVDSFQGGSKYNEWGIEVSNLEKTFTSNMEPYKGRYVLKKGLSKDVLRYNFKEQSFDIIYVDGSHEASDTLIDLVNAFYLLKVGGELLIDDYMWNFNQFETQNTPKEAVDSFLRCFKDKIQLKFISWKTVSIKKTLN